MNNKLNTPAAQDAGLTTLLTAAGARRWVRCHDGSGEAFAAYDVGIADGVVAELCLKVHALEAPAHSAVASEPAHMDTEQSREYLVGFMERHFTDKTYHRYILGGGGRNALAGDFAWQMARALRMLTSAALPPASSSVPWSTRPESNTITLNYSFASAILGALFNGPTLNPTAHERIKQDFAAVMRGDKVPHHPLKFSALNASDVMEFARKRGFGHALDASQVCELADDILAHSQGVTCAKNRISADEIVKIGYEVGIIGPVSDGNAVKFARAILDANRPSVGSAAIVPCSWDQGDPESTEWHTGCGSHWIFNEGGPEENSMIFCHGCGKPIAITSSKGDAP